MRLLFLILAFILPFPAFAVTGDAARFDFANGAPTIIDDTTSACNNQATIRYDFADGQIAQVFDTTATCTSATQNGPPTLLIKGGSIIKGGIIVK